MKSILQKEKKCWLCGSTLNLHRHHKAFDRQLKAWAQERFEEKYGHDLFMEIFKRNYRKGG